VPEPRIDSVKTGQLRPHGEPPLAKEVGSRNIRTAMTPTFAANRRAFLKAGVALAALACAPLFAVEPAPVVRRSLAELTPPKEKNFAPAWLASPTARGEPSVWRTEAERRHLGIPVGGIGSGTVYLGADGRLWVWDIFNVHHEGVVPNKVKGPETDSTDINGVALISERNGSNYLAPPSGESPWNLDNGCALRFADGSTREVDATGFSAITVKGEYPAPTYTYADKACPVAVEMEAVSPFIPLEYDDSSLPVVYMIRRFRNNGDKPVEFTVESRVENGALKLLKTGQESAGVRRHLRRADIPGAKALVGEITGADGSLAPQSARDRGDFGTLALAVLGEGQTAGESSASVSEKQMLRVTSRAVKLAPGETTTVTFVLGWHFPHAAGRITHGKGALPDGRRWVAGKFADAGELVAYAVKHADRLTRDTRLFRDTWYGAESGANRGTLPHWLLERALWTATTLTTNVSYRLANDRFWAWEGVGACEGVCTHVWHYAQSPGRLFPQLERDLRENTDFKAPAMRADGSVDFRGGMAGGWAIDGQAGVVLRSWRQHCMDTSGDFLKKNWPEIKRTTRFLITFDAGKSGKADGVPTDSAHNTLDANWAGTVPWFVSMHNAALIAAAAMADAVGDKEFATECRDITTRGRNAYAGLFNNDAGFYQSNATEKQMLPIHVGKGCHIDMALGDWWLAQTGLPAFGDKAQLRASMSSLFRNNFVPDMGEFRRKWETPAQRGRPYALDGESGLVMCTWPQGGLPDKCRDFWSFGYFQECMTGFEYSAAGLMVALAENERDPLLAEGLAVARAVHDRYAAAKRNPYNEIECSDHYARAMASYGVFLAACGFHTHEPTGLLRFDPKLGAGDFAAPFVTGGAWGRFTQCHEKADAASRIVAGYEVRHGALKLAVLELRPAASGRVVASSVKLGGRALPHSVTFDAGLARVKLAEPVVVRAGESLSVEMETTGN
jgi:non-lysosomal glucosylceramidase